MTKFAKLAGWTAKDHTALVAAIFSAAFSLLTLSTNAAAADKEDKVTVSAFGKQPVTVAGHLKLEGSCKAKELPQLNLLVPPEHGKVCTKEEPVFARTDSHIGRENKCLGTTQPGLRVIYLPDGDYAGVDAFRYEVDGGMLAKVGHQKTKVNVFVQSFGSATEPSFGEQRQAPGAIPPCQTPVS